MNGVHDLGGLDGFSKIQPEPDDKPPYSEAWEGHVLAMTRALGAAGAWNIDVGRYRIKRMTPHLYLSASYYKKWFLHNVRLCLEKGMFTADELKAGHATASAKSHRGSVPNRKTLPTHWYVAAMVAKQAPRSTFEVGYRVRAKNVSSKSHTRVPRFARGHVGVIERNQGCHVYPDAVVAEGHEDPRWL